MESAVGRRALVYTADFCAPTYPGDRLLLASIAEGMQEAPPHLILVSTSGPGFTYAELSALFEGFGATSEHLKVAESSSKASRSLLARLTALGVEEACFVRSCWLGHALALSRLAGRAGPGLAVLYPRALRVLFASSLACHSGFDTLELEQMEMRVLGAADRIVTDGSDSLRSGLRSIPWDERAIDDRGFFWSAVRSVLPLPNDERTGRQLIVYGPLGACSHLNLVIQVAQTFLDRGNRVLFLTDVRILGRETTIHYIQRHVWGAGLEIVVRDGDLAGEARLIGQSQSVVLIPEDTDLDLTENYVALAAGAPQVTGGARAARLAALFPDNSAAEAISGTPDDLVAQIDRLFGADRIAPPVAERSDARRMFSRTPDAAMAEAPEPSLTICIAHRDQSDYLEQALISLARQTKSPDRIVIVDAGSRESEAARVQSLVDQEWPFPIELIRCPPFRPARARNHSVRHVNTELVLFFDADDIALPDLVANMKRSMAGASDRIVVAPAITFQGPAYPEHAEENLSPPLGSSLRLSVLVNRLGHIVFAIRAADFRTLAGFVESEFGSEDYEFLLKAEMKGFDILPLPEANFLYRRTAAGVTAQSASEVNGQRIRAVIRERFGEDVESVIWYCRCMSERLPRRTISLDHRYGEPIKVDFGGAIEWSCKRLAVFVEHFELARSPACQAAVGYLALHGEAATRRIVRHYLQRHYREPATALDDFLSSGFSTVSARLPAPDLLHPALPRVSVDADAERNASDVRWYARQVWSRSAKAGLGPLVRTLIGAIRHMAKGKNFSEAVVRTPVARRIVIEPPANFDEEAYLETHVDVAGAVLSGAVASGFAHYVRHGINEGRQRPTKLSEDGDA